MLIVIWLNCIYNILLNCFLFTHYKFFNIYSKCFFFTFWVASYIFTLIFLTTFKVFFVLFLTFNLINLYWFFTHPFEIYFAHHMFIILYIYIDILNTFLRCLLPTLYVPFHIITSIFLTHFWSAFYPLFMFHFI
jgi:hypothetical protein